MMNQPTKIVQNHDFRRTDLLERVDLQAVQGLLETFTRSATLKFTSTLRQPCVFDVEKLDQVTWRDLVEEFESGMYFFTFSLRPLTGHAVFVMPTEEALALVDLRLAGSGDDDFSGRIPSEIDQDFLASIVGDFITELAVAFGRIQSTVPVLEAQEGNVQFVSIASAGEMCIAVRISFTIANRSSCEALICLPFTMVRMLLDTLQSKTTPASDGRHDFYAAATRQRLAGVPVNVVFQFPSFMTTPAELLTLRVGDSLGLGHPKGRPLEVRAEGLLVALAEICSSGVHKACEIKEEVTK
jgi:flagellar motor switch protein FliM